MPKHETDSTWTVGRLHYSLKPALSAHVRADPSSRPREVLKYYPPGYCSASAESQGVRRTTYDGSPSGFRGPLVAPQEVREGRRFSPELGSLTSSIVSVSLRSC